MSEFPAPADFNPSFAADGSELRCPACDYDLRVLNGDRCPECGLLLDCAGMLVSQIPWTRRGEMGRFRAFRKTCWRVFRHPRRIAVDAKRPVNFQDAKRFQRAVIWIMYLPMAGIGLWALFANANEHPFRQSNLTEFISFTEQSRKIVPPPGLWIGWLLEGFGLIFAAICLWLFLKAVTGVASYFFHPNDLSIPRQNRAIALSYYACAPLAWTPISLAMIVAVALLTQTKWGHSPRGMESIWILGGVLVISVIVQLVSWLRCTLVLLKQTTRCSGARVLTAGIALPFLWIICAILTLGFLPAAYLFVCTVILSLL